MQIDEYEQITFLSHLIADKLKPLKIYLFGSFAEGKNMADSDYDFYVIIPDSDKRNLIDLTVNAQRCLRHKKNRAVDVLVNRHSMFEQLKKIPFSVENNVSRKGIVLYG